MPQMLGLWNLVACLGLWSSSSFAADLDEFSPKRLAATADGKRIAVVSADSKLRLWNASTGHLLHTIELEHEGFAVAFSPDNKLLVVGTTGPRSSHEAHRALVQAWKLDNAKPEQLWKTTVVGQAGGLAIDPKGEWCATCTIYGRVFFLTLKDGEPRRDWLELGNGILDVGVSPDGKNLFTAGQAFRVWDLTLEKLPAQKIELKPFVTEEQGLRFVRYPRNAGGVAGVPTSDSQWAIALGAFADRQGRVTTLGKINLTTGKVEEAIAKDLQGCVCVAVSPDDKTAVVGYNASKLEVFSIPEKKRISEIKLAGFGPVRSLAYLGGNRLLAVASTQGEQVWIVNVTTGEIVERLKK